MMDKAIEASLDNYFVVARRIAVRDDLGMPWRWFNDPIISSLADELETHHGMAEHEAAMRSAVVQSPFPALHIQQVAVRLTDGQTYVDWNAALRTLNAQSWV